MADYPTCPDCGGPIEQTCKGYITGRDENRAWCNVCKWRGKAWQCKPLPPAQMACPKCGKVADSTCGLCCARMILMFEALGAGWSFYDLHHILNEKHQPGRERIPR